MTRARKREINHAWTFFILFRWLFLGLFLLSARATTFVHTNVIPEVLTISDEWEISLLVVREI